MFSRKLKWYLLFHNESDLNDLFINADAVVHRSIHGEHLLVREKGNYYAFKNKCPHQAKPLNGCLIESGEIVCPWHQYRFAIQNGRGHGLYIEKYPLKFEAGKVFIGKERWKLLG